jgi:hypothetical protein
MTTTVAKKKPTSRKLTIDEMIALEVAAFDHRALEIVEEMSRPKKTAKPPKTPK